MIPDPLLFELRMRGISIEDIAEQANVPASVLHQRLEQMHPTFESETDAFLAQVEKVALFKGMNVIVVSDNVRNVMGSQQLPGNKEQLGYLQLAVDARMHRLYNRMNNAGPLEDLDEDDEEEDEDF